MRSPSRSAPAALLVAFALAACGETTAPAPPPAAEPEAARERAPVADLPPALAANVRAADTLVGEGREAFQARLDALEGVPVVVNQWASWCAACRFELPFFEEATVTFRDEVAFLGLDSRDDRGAAEAFLREFPSGFPSVYDPDAAVARSLGGGRSWPMTFFFDASGEQVHTRIGAYAGPEQLAADIRRFALGTGA